MINIEYNTPPAAAEYAINLIQRIRDVGGHGGIRTIDFLSYVSKQILRKEDPTSRVHWQCPQQSLDLSKDWFKVLGKSQQDNLRTFYSNVDPNLQLFKTSESQLMVNRCPSGNDVFYTFLNSELQAVFSDSFQRLYAENLFNPPLKIAGRVDGNVVTTHKGNLYQNLTIDEPVAIIETRINYGHFTMEYLPLFYILGEVPELRNLKVLTYKLTDIQIEMLKNINFDFKRIIQFDMEPGTGVSFFLRESYVFNRLNPVISSDLLKTFTPETDPADSFEFVYLSRDKLPYARLENHVEVDSMLGRQGFHAFHTSDLSVCEIMRRIKHSKVIVSTIGAQLVNALYANNAIIILIYPVLPRTNPLMDLIFDKGLSAGFPCFNNLLLVPCQVNQGVKGRALFDMPAIVDVNVLEKLVLDVKRIVK